MSHTEGPWEIVNGCDIYSLKGADSGDGVPADSTDGWHIASIGDCPTFVDGVETELGENVKRANANVLLMAPQLLLALEGMISIFPAGVGDGPSGGIVFNESLKQKYRSAVKAVAKARGQV